MKETKVKNNPLSNREIIIEFYPLGNYMKVSALDAETLTEVSIQGPINGAKETLKQNALKRLEYVMKKKGLI